MLDLDAVSEMKVLFIGDGIIDKYVFCRALGKSIKETVISVQRDREEEYDGGVWAAAHHLFTLCKTVDVHAGERVFVNTRYLEEVYNRKLFTLHDFIFNFKKDVPPIREYDLVVVCDFGHGTMTPEMIERVTKEARFLAVNAQTNSTNYGFNMITKYPRADYVVVDELEARLAVHDKDSPIEEVIIKLGYPKIAVTLGANGAIGFDGDFYRHDATAGKIVDTMGAGDAFLAVSSPFAAQLFGMKDLITVGNAAGALKVATLGHRSSITKDALDQFLRSTT